MALLVIALVVRPVLRLVAALIVWRCQSVDHCVGVSVCGSTDGLLD